ncbi:hypothetical protein M0R45_025507 [Rubus argutus]|uniref:mRNA capping enzyme adenylation domain-containing protein n=1 Tax=Rubus argutus TaxID=59490 RepID=A0AAW1WU66_RUBAR
MRFPCIRTKVNGVAEKSIHHYTLLDWEMVIDTLPGSQKKQRRYLIYDNDMMAINNSSVVQWPFHERWKTIAKEVIEPARNHQCRNNPDYRYDLEPFKGWDDQYVMGTHEGLPKWKFPAINSVDFLFEVGGDGRQLLFLYEHGKKKLMEGNRVAFKEDNITEGDLLNEIEKIIRLPMHVDREPKTKQATPERNK